MMTSLVLTVIGPDKPGLVEMLAQTIANNSGNWLESGMSRLAGKFAGILITEVPKQNIEQLINDLSALESQGLKVTAERSDAQENTVPTQQFTLELVGHDKPGIVRDISSVLAKHHVNVERLTTELVSGSMSAELLFKAEAELLASTDLDLDELQTSIENIANDLMVDIVFNK
ncbi:MULTISPECIES: glycine cleavage system protein R [unclassified Neptuniibacter]|jgi:glycine cleavage system regulatory protein|uniref:glycine cleavage system protein R n=1 Tax=unclassified Neptuniibacter TaxID=2630693 RepID=UPI0026E25DAC|nr:MULTISPECIES: ACT domain-containing protein [unclassified Neptuniibacter]MDO6514912.1 ACT domain-containing protein [Neptuniibacter sp. 2_MG-2023]MDO6594510.1 ACT domain-containing protein [Neptuniibacter sp. 1_MG-2023]